MAHQNRYSASSGRPRPPERLSLARQQHLAPADFLELRLADEVTRRDANSASLRARAAGLDPAMRVETWDPHR